MADTDLTGATTEKSVDVEATKEARKKLIIKVVVILAVLFVAYFLYKRFIK